VTNDPQVQGAKADVREQVWSMLERDGVARFPGARGRIPNFVGAEEAARRLAMLPEWKTARTVKANPDAPQLPVRRSAVAEGKTVYMAVPRLRDEKPFLRLADDATIKASGARPTALEELDSIDLIVCGTVAVDRAGVRIGKGGGYSDLEFGLLADRGLVSEATTIVTTVHALQVLESDLPETAHDFRVDVIVTPDGVIRTPKPRRPRGILWGHLDEAKIESIPVLAARR
jgi:5-formyltetrahydrofolate cyclo-ligase